MSEGQRYLQAFAILRVDGFQPETTPISHRVTVKKIVWTQPEAESEVERLNQLAAGQAIEYFWQTTRVVHPQLAADSAGQE
jgi:hypothetical protein